MHKESSKKYGKHFKISHIDIIDFLVKVTLGYSFRNGIIFNKKDFINPETGNPFSIQDLLNSETSKITNFYGEDVNTCWFDVYVEPGEVILVSAYKPSEEQSNKKDIIEYSSYEGFIDVMEDEFLNQTITHAFTYFNDMYTLHISFDKVQISKGNGNGTRHTIDIPNYLEDLLKNESVGVTYMIKSPIDDAKIVLNKNTLKFVFDTWHKLNFSWLHTREIVNRNTDMLVRKRIIAIHGLKGSGKDTITTLIKYHIAKFRKNVLLYFSDAIENISNDNFCSNYVRVERFAKPIKSLIASMMGFDESYLNLPEAKNIELDHDTWYTPTESIFDIRHLHTLIGDKMKDIFNSDIFARTCISRCKNSDTDIVVIPDLRFRNELDILKKESDVYLVAVSRPGIEPSEHESEQGLPFDEFDYQIRNDGSIEELNIKVIDMLIDCGLIDNHYAKEQKEQAH